MKDRFILCFCLCAVVLVVSSRQPAAAGCRSFSGLLESGAWGVADAQGRIIAACNPDQPFIPASILKIATGLAALRILGPEYRFTTDFFLDDAANLYIRGAGDPFLVSEEVDRIAGRLREAGLTGVRGIVVDSSRYQLEDGTPGQGSSSNPYDVPVVAVAVNFNTVKIRVDNGGGVVSAEPQTPDLPIMAELGAGLAPGVYRLNVCPRDCAVSERTGRYVAELFRALLIRQGVSVGTRRGSGQVPDTARLIYRHENSRSLEEVIRLALAFSNNFVANQVFLACGVARYGFPATWDKANQSVDSVLLGLLGPGAVWSAYDGAGLSRRNRVTVEEMVQVLADFRPYSHLLALKRGIRLKSGTLQGVYNYAGYLANGLPFVILLNQPVNNRDRILERLNRQYGLNR